MKLLIILLGIFCLITETKSQLYGSSLASGIYFYNITAKGSTDDRFSKTMKLILVK